MRLDRLCLTTEGGIMRMQGSYDLARERQRQAAA